MVGNGDIRTGEDALRMRQETGCQGIMMARGTHGSPWLFQQARAALEGEVIPPDPDIPERFQICLRHARNAIAHGGDPKRAAVEFRKHLGWYTKGIPDGKKLRVELFQVTSLKEMEGILDQVPGGGPYRGGVVREHSPRGECIFQVSLHVSSENKGAKRLRHVWRIRSSVPRTPESSLKNREKHNCQQSTGTGRVTKRWPVS